MGVKGLWQLLLPTGRRISIETLAGKRLAVDASIWLTQFLKANRDPETGKVRANAHIVGFLRRICRLLYHGIRPIFVFDGETPAIKLREIRARRERRERLYSFKGDGDDENEGAKRLARRLLIANLKKQKELERAEEKIQDGKKLSNNNNKNSGKGGTLTMQVLRNATRREAKNTGAFARGFRLPDQEDDDDVEDLTQTNNDEHGISPQKSTGNNLNEKDSSEIVELSDSEDYLQIAAQFHQPTKNNDWGNLPGNNSTNNDADSDGADSDDGSVDIPYDDGNLDVAALSNFDSKTRVDVIEKARRQQRMQSRRTLLSVAANPQSYSQCQIQNFLKSANLNIKVNQLGKVISMRGDDGSGLEGERIASDGSRRFIFTKDGDDNEKPKETDAKEDEQLASLKRDREEEKKIKGRKRLRTKGRRDSERESESDEELFVFNKEAEVRLFGNASSDDEQDQKDLQIGIQNSLMESAAAMPTSSTQRRSSRTQQRIAIDLSEDDSEASESGGGGFMSAPIGRTHGEHNEEDKGGTGIISRKREVFTIASDEESNDNGEGEDVIISSSDRNCHDSTSRNDFGEESGKGYMSMPRGGEPDCHSQDDVMWEDGGNVEEENNHQIGSKFLSGHDNNNALETVNDSDASSAGGGGFVTTSNAMETVNDSDASSAGGGGFLTTSNAMETVNDSDASSTGGGGFLATSNAMETVNDSDASSTGGGGFISASNALNTAHDADASSDDGGGGFMTAPDHKCDGDPDKNIENADKSGTRSLKADESEIIEISTVFHRHSHQKGKRESTDGIITINQSQQQAFNKSDAKVGLPKKELHGVSKKTPPNGVGLEGDGQVENRIIDASSRECVQHNTDIITIRSNDDDSSSGSEPGGGFMSDKVYQGDAPGDGGLGMSERTFSDAQEVENTIILESHPAVNLDIGNRQGDGIEQQDGQEDVNGESNDEDVDWQDGDENEDIDEDGKYIDLRGDGCSDEDQIDWQDGEDICEIQESNQVSNTSIEVPDDAISIDDDSIEIVRDDLNIDDVKHMSPVSNHGDFDANTAALKNAQATAAHLTDWAGRAVQRAIAAHLGENSTPKDPDEVFSEERNANDNESVQSEEQVIQDVIGQSSKSAAPIVHEFVDTSLEALQNEDAMLRDEENRRERDMDTISDDMIEEVMQLLVLFNIPYMRAPAEAEAQCVELEKLGLADGVITEDSDAIVFGSAAVYRHCFDDKKFVEVYLASDALKIGVGLNEKIALAMLLGGDYTEGVKGVGIVNGMEILQTFSVKNGVRDGLAAFRKWLDGFDGLKEKDEDKNNPALNEFRRKHKTARERWVAPKDFPSANVLQAYSKPVVDSSDENFSWDVPHIENIRLFCSRKMGWESEETDRAVMPVIEAMKQGVRQTRLDGYFMRAEDNIKFAEVRSKRLREVWKLDKKKPADKTTNDDNQLDNHKEEA